MFEVLDEATFRRNLSGVDVTGGKLPIPRVNAVQESGSNIFKNS